METQAPDKPRRVPWKKALLVLAVLALPCVVMAAAGALFLFRQAGGPPDSSLSGEARLQVLRLCGDVQAYRDEHGVFLTAGPLPKLVPRGKAVPFPRDEAFAKLGFQPGERVHYQYEVVVQEDPVGEPEVTCYARGDLDGDGQVSVLSVTLDANGMTSPVKVEREDE